MNDEQRAAISDLANKIIAGRANIKEVDALIAWLRRERQTLEPHCNCWLADDAPSELHLPPCPLAK